MAVELTLEEALLIVRTAFEIGNAAAIAANTPDLVRPFDSIDASTQAMAIGGVVRMVEAMQRVGYKIVPRSEEELMRHMPPVEDPQGLVCTSADGTLTHVYRTTDAPPCDGLTLSLSGTEKLIALLQVSLKRRTDVKEGA